jgi:hypothetical protein
MLECYLQTLLVKKIVVKTICSCLFNLCIELLLVSSCSTFIDGFHAYCKNEHGW